MSVCRNGDAYSMYKVMNNNNSNCDPLCYDNNIRGPLPTIYMDQRFFRQNLGFVDFGIWNLH